METRSHRPSSASWLSVNLVFALSPLQPVHLHKRSGSKYKVLTTWPWMLQLYTGRQKYPCLPYCSMKSILIRSVASFSEFSPCIQLSDPSGWEVYCTLIHCNCMRKWPSMGLKVWRSSSDSWPRTKVGVPGSISTIFASGCSGVEAKVLKIGNTPVK